MKVSRKFNLENNITGCLLYYKREFLQILEGEETVILELYHRIEEDKRHHHVTLLYNEKLEVKAFPNWSMAYKELTDDDVDKLKVHLNLNEFLPALSAQ